MSYDFAKIFKRDVQQILVQRELADNSDSCIKYTTETSFGFINVTLTFNSQEKAQEYFDKVTEKIAFGVLDTMIDEEKK